MESHGPLLLPLWAVTEKFPKGDNCVFLGKCEPKPDCDHHSMLAVGHRRCAKSGSTRLLLQNWWRKKQFVEVGEAFYKSCMEAHAQYVMTPQRSIPASFDTTDAVFSVSTVDGAGVAGFGAGPAGAWRQTIERLAQPTARSE